MSSVSKVSRDIKRYQEVSRLSIVSRVIRLSRVSKRKKSFMCISSRNRTCSSRNRTCSSRNRTKLAATIMGFRVQEGKKENSNRVSTNDLKCFLEREGLSRDMIRRAVTIRGTRFSKNVSKFTSQPLYVFM